MNSNLAIAEGRTLIQKYPNAAGNIDIDSSSWTKSLFKHMGYVHRIKTSSKFKVKIPDDARREIEFLFHHEIVTAIKKNNMRGSMIINIGQVPLKYIPTSNFTLAQKGATSVTIDIEGGNDKSFLIVLSLVFFSLFFGFSRLIFICMKLPVNI